MVRISWFFNNEIHTKHIICWMSSCWQHTPSNWCLIHGADIILFLCDLFFVVCWSKPDIWHFRVKDFVVGFVQTLKLIVPTSTIKIQSVDIASVCWRLAYVEILGSFTNHIKFKVKSVDWQFVFSGKVLKNTCQEGLSEKETRYPEIWRSTCINPFLHEFQSLNKIINPASQWLQARIWNFMPNIRHFIIVYAIKHKL